MIMWANLVCSKWRGSVLYAHPQNPTSLPRSWDLDALLVTDERSGFPYQAAYTKGEVWPLMTSLPGLPSAEAEAAQSLLLCPLASLPV